MGGFFGVTSHDDCVFDLFYGIDYHSHLGTRRAGIAVYDENTGFARSIHNIENAPFRTKFANESTAMHGKLGVGCISDYEAQPILMRSHHGSFAITTVGKINNIDYLAGEILKEHAHFFEMQNGAINQTELVASLINQKENIIDGIKYAQESIDGSISILILTPKCLYAARDKFGRTPVVIGKKNGSGHCVSLEDFAYMNLGYSNHSCLKPGEIVAVTPDEIVTLYSPNNKMKICTFLWVYFGYPSSSYEGLSVEQMRYKCGKCLAMRDKGTVEPDIVAGIPDSGTAHAIGYANESGTRYARPFIKYTPTWPRSFLPSHENKRHLIAKMKLIALHDLIKDKKLLLIDDSIVRGTQLGETTQFLYDSGAKEVHIRTGCPPVLFDCKYLNFSNSKSTRELIARRAIRILEGCEPTDEIVQKYTDPESAEYENLLEQIRKMLNFTTLKYLRLDDMLDAVGIGKENLCTYCWNGKE